MRRQVLTLGVAGLLLMLLEAHADNALTCGDTTYVVEKSFVGGVVMELTSASEAPFCISDDPVVLTKTLSFRNAEVWCVTSHHLSPNSRPLAKQIWILNTLSKKLYSYDYLFANNVWVLEEERIETCGVVPKN
jgi:hypothetical protein